MGDFWVFGYGSLMWRPGFEAIEAVQATIHGVHRALCVYSWVHRGTRERPGLVFGLDRGGSCRGMAFRITQELRDEVQEYLRARELVTNVYLEVVRPVTLISGKKVHAVTYVVDRTHTQYASPLPLDATACQINGAVGQSGANEDYILSTYSHLQELEIRDHKLEQLVRKIGRSVG